LNAEKPVKGRDPRLKIIVKDNRDDGHREPKSGGHQGFRNTGGNGESSVPATAILSKL
jgi:hypothetical protein